MIDWTEKYRPRSLHDIIGNQKSVYALKKWANQWKVGKPEKKAVILSGNPGIGKTSCAYALANQYHWIAIELNTSDTRNKATIKSIATSGSQHQTFTNDGSYVSTKQGGRKLIILDEADNLYERIAHSSNTSDMSDKGGKQAIVETIKITKQPIILIVNDYYNLTKGSGDILKKLCVHLTFYPPQSYQIFSLLQAICKKEAIKVDKNVLQLLSTDCKGDIRSVIRDLQSISIGKKIVREDDANALGFRDRQQLIFDVLSVIFSTKDIEKIRKNMYNVNEDPNRLIQWINENLPYSYNSIVDLVNAYENLSKADLYLGRTLRRNNYSMWSYASDHMGIGVSISKSIPVASNRYKYPTWIKKKKKLLTNEEKSIIQKIASYHHCSLLKAQKTMLPIYKKITKQNKSNLLILLKNFNLSDDEMMYFYGAKFKNNMKNNHHAENNVIEKKEKKVVKKQKTLFSSV